MTERLAGRRPRLLVLSSTYPRWQDDARPGFVHALARRLVADFDVLVLTPRSPGAAATEVLDGVHVRRYAYLPARWERLQGEGGLLPSLRRHPLRLLQLPALLLATWLALRRAAGEGVQAVHAHWLPWAWLASLALPGLPVLATAHGSDVFALRGASWRWLRRMAVRRSAKTTTVSRLLADRLLGEGCDASGLAVLPMGVDMQAMFTPSASRPDPRRLVFVGRLVDAKGPGALLKAMPRVLAVQPGARLVVVGEGPLRAGLEAEAAALGIAAAVEFAGPLPADAVAERLRQSAVCVMPGAGASRVEGLGLVAIEALACGCRLVGGPNPALAGMLPEAAPVEFLGSAGSEELAGAILRAIDAGPASADAGYTGFREALARRFDWEAVAQAYSVLLAGLVAEAGGRRR